MSKIQEIYNVDGIHQESQLYDAHMCRLLSVSKQIASVIYANLHNTVYGITCQSVIFINDF